MKRYTRSSRRQATDEAERGTARIYFSDYFEVAPDVVDRYGAFNISLIADIPLFIDPFLLFNSRRAEYQALHDRIIEYVRFLKERSVRGVVTPGLVRAWYRFPEVKQTWLGFSGDGNRGRGLGKDFAEALHRNLHEIFRDFGTERVTQGSHLEKLCLIKDGVGRDNISDFTTNLILEFLLGYSQRFAQKHLRPDQRRRVMVSKVRFNYDTETWDRDRFELPWYKDDYVLLTPKEILTKDDTWINKTDLIDEFERLPIAIPNEALRAQIDNYFRRALPKSPKRKDERAAAARTILRFPEVIDYYIRDKEKRGDQASHLSAEKVGLSHALYVRQYGELAQQLAAETGFYGLSGNTYAEARDRVEFLKDVIENKGGHRIFYTRGRPIERESDLHILYRLTWYATPSDVSREVNDGRGPVDFKVSRGARDKTLVEFKLASNPQLKRNLQRQVPTYAKASDARRAIKVIFYFSQEQLARVEGILREVTLLGDRDIVLVDARQDNKPSGSRA